jgi:hypothetical protein
MPSLSTQQTLLNTSRHVEAQPSFTPDQNRSDNRHGSAQKRTKT